MRSRSSRFRITRPYVLPRNEDNEVFVWVIMKPKRLVAGKLAGEVAIFFPQRFPQVVSCAETDKE